MNLCSNCGTEEVNVRRHHQKQTNIFCINMHDEVVVLIQNTTDYKAV